MFFIKIQFILLFLPFSLFNAGNSQPFEGRVEILQTTIADTSHFEFLIKDKLIKINQFNSNNTIERVFMVNMTEKMVYEISDERKVYIKYALRESNLNEAEQEFIEIKKTTNYKYLNGYQCYQWLVTNKIKNTTVSYWVAKEEFSYLVEILLNINRSDKKCSYYMFIPDYEEFFPMESVERGLLREFRAQDEIRSIKKQKINDIIFQIPPDYFEIHK